MELSKIAFLDSFSPGDDTDIMGAILLTDGDTKPLEFRVTAPIQPTNFQKTLYGNVLLEHILVELIGVPLINSVKEDIDLILVRDPLFLGVNRKQDIRTVRVFGENGASNSGSPSKELNSFPGNNGKVHIEIDKNFESELSEISDRLNIIAETRNLTEPFERLKVACEQIHLRKSGE